MRTNNPLRIAAIHPDASPVKILEAELRNAGLAVSFSRFPTASQALKALAVATPVPDVIVMSWRVSANPLDVFRAFRAIARLEKVPVFILAANKGEERAAADTGITILRSPLDQKALKNLKLSLNLETA